MPGLLRLLASLAAWGLLAPVAAAAEVIGSTSTTGNSTTTGVFEVDIVFPRNQTYAPSPHMPIVFAVHNLELGHLLNPSISFDVWSTKTNMSKNYGDMWYLVASKRSGDSLFYQGYANYDIEDHWAINWHLDWESCFEDDLGNKELMTNSTGGRIEFTTSREASKELDLVAALQDGSSCQTSAARSPGGVAIEITGAMMNPWTSMPSACGIVAPALPAPSPCAVTVEAAAATSIAAQVTADVCLATDNSQGCIPRSSGAQSLAVGGVAGLAMAVGGLAIILGFL